MTFLNNSLRGGAYGRGLWMILGLALVALAIFINKENKRVSNGKLAHQPSSVNPSTKVPAPKNRDWPIYRGDSSLTGYTETELPDSLKLKWVFKTDDAIKSSPIIVDGKVFVGSADSYFYALEASSGKLLWKHQTDGKILGAANGVSLPKENLTKIFVGSYDSKLYCFNSKNGKVLWSYETGSYIHGAPAINRAQVVFGGCDATLHALSAANGQKITAIPTGAYIASSVALSGAHAYVGNYGNQFLCADIQTGKTVWMYENGGFPFFSSAAIEKTRVVVGSRDKRLHCLAREDGKLFWTFLTRGEVDSSPIICQDKIIFGSNDGRLYMVKLSDGKEIWSYEIGQAITSSPAIAEGMVVVGSDDGSLYAFGSEN